MKEIFKRILVIFLCISSTIFMCCDESKSNITKPNIKQNSVSIDKKNDTLQKVATNPDDIFKRKDFVYDTTKKYIYLTFDDGPQPGTTTCVDICKKLGVKATFFMVGNHASNANLKNIVKNIKYSYPLLLLSNHSTTHANGRYHYFYNHEYMALNDFLQAQDKLSVPYKIIRLPGNTSWVRTGQIRANKETKPVCKLLDSVGYNVLGWDVEWNFNRKNAYPVESAEKMYRVVTNAANENYLNEKNHVVILTHDRMFRNQSNADSLTKFITLLKEHKNYVFETMDNYPKLKKL
jgi:peptidoglycan/xylan/chitin deacetylase (PgdA/CDA1 family)